MHTDTEKGDNITGLDETRFLKKRNTAYTYKFSSSIGGFWFAETCLPSVVLGDLTIADIDSDGEYELISIWRLGQRNFQVWYNRV